MSGSCGKEGTKSENIGKQVWKKYRKVLLCLILCFATFSYKYSKNQTRNPSFPEVPNKSLMICLRDKVYNDPGALDWNAFAGEPFVDSFRVQFGIETVYVSDLFVKICTDCTSINMILEHFYLGKIDAHSANSCCTASVFQWCSFENMVNEIFWKIGTLDEL